MKLGFILILISLLQVTASVYSQTATIRVDKRNATISDVFNAIERQTEYKIFYKNDQLDVSRPAEIGADQIMVKDALGQMFQDNNCDYTMFDRLIVVTPKTEKQGITIDGDCDGMSPAKGCRV